MDGAINCNDNDRPQTDYHHFESLLVLAITAVAFPGRSLGGHEDPLRFPSRVTNSLSCDWQIHVLVSSGYLELRMFDDAALILEEINPEDKTRSEILGAPVVHPIRAEIKQMRLMSLEHRLRASQ